MFDPSLSGVIPPNVHYFVPPAAPAAGVAQRILILMHDFSGGGTERVAVRLANQWAKAGRDVHIFCGSEDGPTRTMVDPAIRVEQADPALPRGPLSRVRLGFALARVAARLQPDVIWAPGNFHILALAAFSLRDRSTAATFCKISNPLVRRDRRGPAGWLRWLTLKLLTARIDTLVAMSPALQAEAETLFDRSRVAAQWEPIFSSGGMAKDAIAREPGLVIAAGRLEPQKNFELAISAMSRLPAGANIRMIILGEGGERARLSQLIADLGLQKRVLLAGHVRDIRPWLRRAACFLMTSHYEGYPAALVEAVVSGAPVLVTPCSPALREIVPTEGSAQIVRADADAVAAALLELLDRPYMPPDATPLMSRHDEHYCATSYLALIDRRLAHKRAGRA